MCAGEYECSHYYTVREIREGLLVKNTNIIPSYIGRIVNIVAGDSVSDDGVAVNVLDSQGYLHSLRIGQVLEILCDEGEQDIVPNVGDHVMFDICHDRTPCLFGQIIQLKKDNRYDIMHAVIKLPGGCIKMRNLTDIAFGKMILVEKTLNSYIEIKEDK